MFVVGVVFAGGTVVLGWQVPAAVTRAWAIVHASECASSDGDPGTGCLARVPVTTMHVDYFHRRRLLPSDAIFVRNRVGRPSQYFDVPLPLVDQASLSEGGPAELLVWEFTVVAVETRDGKTWTLAWSGRTGWLQRLAYLAFCLAAGVGLTARGWAGYRATGRVWRRIDKEDIDLSRPQAAAVLLIVPAGAAFVAIITSGHHTAVLLTWSAALAIVVITRRRWKSPRRDEGES